MSFNLQYEVADAGWADCRVAFGEDFVSMTASYLHDSLHQLCDVVANVVNGAQAGIVLFMDEPGEHELRLERSGENDVVFRVVWYHDWKSWGLCSESDGKAVLQGRTTVAHLRAQVYSTVRHILESLGKAEYRRRWVEHDFPVPAFSRLEKC
jgi:hypothetical protein